jgi:hypothetical protein
MMKLLGIITVFVIVLFIGCSTPYAKAGFMGGFKEVKIDSTKYKVEFSGNGMTSRETVVKYMLYRCSEITVEAGYKYFEISYEDNATNTNATQNYNTTTNSVNTTVIVKHSSEATIRLFNEKPVKMRDNIYNAKQFMTVNEIK